MEPNSFTQQPETPATKPKLTLFTLPAEIRNHIWEYVTTSGEIGSKNLKFLLTCRRMREAEEMAWTNTCFVFHSSDITWLRYCLLRAPTEHKNHITSIQLPQRSLYQADSEFWWGTQITFNPQLNTTRMPDSPVFYGGREPERMQRTVMLLRSHLQELQEVKIFGDVQHQYIDDFGGFGSGVDFVQEAVSDFLAIPLAPRVTVLSKDARSAEFLMESVCHRFGTNAGPERQRFLQSTTSQVDHSEPGRTSITIYLSRPSPVNNPIFRFGEDLPGPYCLKQYGEKTVVFSIIHQKEV